MVGEKKFKKFAWIGLTVFLLITAGLGYHLKDIRFDYKIYTHSQYIQSSKDVHNSQCNLVQPNPKRQHDPKTTTINQSSPIHSQQKFDIKKLMIFHHTILQFKTTLWIHAKEINIGNYVYTYIHTKRPLG